MKNGIACLTYFFLVITFLVLSTPLAGASQALELKLVSLTSPISRGNDATLVIQTVDNANCRINVHYKTGTSKAKGLVPKTADATGQASWAWKVESRTPPGIWPITILCSKNDAHEVLQVPFVVRK